MCGIVGLFLKDRGLDSQLGLLLNEMLITMTERGPDSAGIALYSTPNGAIKLTIQSPDPDRDFPGLEHELAGVSKLVRKDSHAVLYIDPKSAAAARQTLRSIRPDVRVMSSGESIEIYKEVGLPKDVAARFGLSQMSGTHGIGHTRMATESAVTTMGAHPFSTGPDQCLAHNGSLSNHNSLRRALIQEGMEFETLNDSEVAAAYISHKLKNGAKLGDALESGLDDLDGFFNFLVGTHDGFGVVRDPIACKPAVMAETEQYVAFGSEYRALVGLPGFENARVWEPEPATVYFWEH